MLLDLSRANGAGVETIHKIRRQSAVPILVVYGGDDSDAHKYRTAGAANCIVAPVDVVTLNQVLQQIVRDSGQIAAPSARDVQAVKFAGMIFYPRQNLVSGPDGAQSHLTTAENRLWPILSPIRGSCTRGRHWSKRFTDGIGRPPTGRWTCSSTDCGKS